MDQKFFEKPLEGQPWDVAIIGSGPSAFTAAIYTTRGAASTLVLGGANWGGQLMLTTDVDNFPGFPEGIQGPELMEKMRAQAERFHAEIKDEDVHEVELEGSPFNLKTDSGEYKANSIIIATGADTKWLGIPGEDKLRGRGVSSCAPCDAPFFKDKKVVVVGGGDSAMEEAMVLSKYASKVILMHRRDEFKASQAMLHKVFAEEKIQVFHCTEAQELLGEFRLEKAKMKSWKQSKHFNEINEMIKSNDGNQFSDDEEYIYWEMPIDGVFVAIGHVPATNIFKGKIDLDEKGYVKKMEKDGFKMATSKDGVFVAGDVHDHHYRQAITAAGFGCMAGMDTLSYLDKEPPRY